MKHTIALGGVEIGAVPRIVGVIGVGLDASIDYGKKASEAGADILEVRADKWTLEDAECDHVVEVLNTLKAETQRPLLLTIRRLSDCGDFFGSEPERLTWFQRLLPHIDAVDIEIYASEIQEEVISAARERQRTVVASYHDFLKTPPLSRTPRERVNLDDLIYDALEIGADITKIAVTAQSYEDVVCLTTFTAEHANDCLLSTISMGHIGSFSRVVNPFAGSCLTYGCIDKTVAVHGQLSISHLRSLMHLVPEGGISEKQAVEMLEVARTSGLFPDVPPKDTASQDRLLELVCA